MGENNYFPQNFLKKSYFPQTFSLSRKLFSPNAIFPRFNLKKAIFLLKGGVINYKWPVLHESSLRRILVWDFDDWWSYFDLKIRELAFRTSSHLGIVDGSTVRQRNGRMLGSLCAFQRIGEHVSDQELATSSPNPILFLSTNEKSPNSLANPIPIDFPFQSPPLVLLTPNL